jgi:hypothetical protein
MDAFAGGEPVSDIGEFLRGPLPLHHARVPFAIAWTPKAGCTSLTKWFLFHSGELAQGLAYHRLVHRYRIEVFQARPGYVDEWFEMVEVRTRPIFKLVRNPYDRAASAYFHTLRALAKSRGDREPGLARAARQMLALSGLSTRVSFRQFIAALSESKRQSRPINPHLDPQYRTGEDVLIARVLKLESFEPEMRALEAQYGLAAAPLDIITHSSHHRSKSPVEPGSLADAALDDDALRGEEAPAYDAFYDRPLRELVSKLYADDFARYGYAI